MSFLDYILAGFGVRKLKNDDQEKTKNDDSLILRKNSKDNFLPQAKNSKLAIFCPTNLEDILKATEFLGQKEPVLINVSMLEKSVVKRAFDIILGGASAAGATCECVGEGLYVFAPSGTKILNRINEDE
ncbi:MAG: cell division protein SepF [Clostridia bacterium]|nr:cell division protein SepF [Clostridia bacterium]